MECSEASYEAESLVFRHRVSLSVYEASTMCQALHPAKWSHEEDTVPLPGQEGHYI